MGYPIAGWFVRENPINLEDLGVPPLMSIRISAYLLVSYIPEVALICGSSSRSTRGAQEQGGARGTLAIAAELQRSGWIV